jgi:hypothetical protein
VGNGLDPKNLIGPVSNKMQLDKVSGYVDDARARGARIVTGGVRPDGPGYFYPLTVIANVTDDMRVVKEEQFGPVIPVIKYRSVDEAIRRANSLEVGLGGSVWGNDTGEAAKYASRRASPRPLRRREKLRHRRRVQRGRSQGVHHRPGGECCAVAPERAASSCARVARTSTSGVPR